MKKVVGREKVVPPTKNRDSWFAKLCKGSMFCRNSLVEGNFEKGRGEKRSPGVNCGRNKHLVCLLNIADRGTRYRVPLRDSKKKNPLIGIAPFRGGLVR